MLMIYGFIPATKVEEPAELLQVKELSATVLKKLNKRRQYLVFSSEKTNRQIGLRRIIGIMLCLKGISEAQKVSPGTMSLLVNPGHAL